MFALHSEIDQTISAEEFDYFRRVVEEKAGIDMPPQKWTLVQSRLRSRLTALSLKSFPEYKTFLERISPEHEEWAHFLNQLTTNKTDWFREDAHFAYLRDVLIPEWKKLGKTHFAVWSAACSSGEEPYTLALVLEEALGPDYTYEITASDVNTEVLAYARNGVYPRSTVEDQVPERFLRHGFSFGTEDIAEWVKVRDSIRKCVRYQQVNLIEIPEGFKPLNADHFDLVFCRNVFIYFNSGTIQQVVQSFEKVTTPESHLFISHCETLQKISSKWKLVKPSILRKRV